MDASGITGVLVLAALAGVMAYFLYTVGLAWRRTWATDRPLLLDRMLKRVGVVLPETYTHASASELAHAARRCAGCGSEHACQEWLDSSQREGFQEFCPNAELIERLRRPAA